MGSVGAETLVGEAPSGWDPQSRARHLGRSNLHVYVVLEEEEEEEEANVQADKEGKGSPNSLSKHKDAVLAQLFPACTWSVCVSQCWV